MARTRHEAMASVVADPAGVYVDEPPRPSRIRKPSDAMRFLASAAALGLVLLLTNIARHTANGLASDITHGTEQAPHFLLNPASLLSSFGVLAVPVVFAVDRLIRRDGLRIAVGLFAAVAALIVTVGVDEWAMGSGGAVDLLSRGEGSHPLHTDITPVIAYVTAVRLAGRTRWQLITWSVVWLAALTALSAGYTSIFALAATYFTGRAIGYGTLYAVGTPNPRPSGLAVGAALHRMGFVPISARRLTDDRQQTRRYCVKLGQHAHGEPGRSTAPCQRLEVAVIDRDQQTAGLLYRIWRSVLLRRSTNRRPLRSVRRSLEQETLMAYALRIAGVRTPRLMAACEVGSEAALLAYEHVPGRLLDALGDDELDDELLTGIWQQVRLLQANRLAHRRLEGTGILLGDDGRLYIVDLRGGEIAASDLVLRLDLAQLLTTLALRVGPERAVRTAATTLGTDTLVASLPLLQKVALGRSTRVSLRHEKELLSQIREQVLRLRPEIAVEPVRLERLRPRTLVSVIAAAAGAYFVLSQLSDVDLERLVTHSDAQWAAVGLAASAMSFLAAAFMLIGFVPERLPLGHTILVQLAGSFVKLVAPAVVTGMAINTRYLQRSGIRPGPAVASVGASQLSGMMTQIVLLATFGFITGSSQNATDLTPSRRVVIVLLAVGVLAAGATAFPRVRRLVISRLRPMFAGVVPRLLDVIQSPKKITTGVGGTLLLTTSFVVCLAASIRAFGGSLPWTTLIVVFLAGNAIGSAAPTPGGLGAVEGALSLGLTLSGLPAEIATSAVLLFRLLTFWLPALPGWAAFAYLQRKQII